MRDRTPKVRWEGGDRKRTLGGEHLERSVVTGSPGVEGIERSKMRGRA